LTQLDQDRACGIQAYYKKELHNFYYLLTFQPEKVMLDGDVK